MRYDEYIRKTRINAPVEKVFQWHARNGAISRLTPPWAPLKLVRRNKDGIQKGVRVVFEISVFKIPMVWEAEHIAYEENSCFKDRQVRGPFARWEHTHRFIREADNITVMTDHVEFRLPLGMLSRPFYGFAKKEFDRMFQYRHRVLKQDVENWADITAPKRILVSGASGTIGSSLVPFLRTCGHEVVRLVRKKKDLAPDELSWDPHAGDLDLENAGPFDAVINLNGVDISRGRWTNRRRQEIMDSRRRSTRLLAEKIAGLKHKPGVFLSSSAIGFYGDRQEDILMEPDKKGECFISKVCSLWEDESRICEDAGIRTVQLRIGIVLTPAGGALERMQTPFKFGCGVRLSSGRQFMSWISMDDLLAAILFIIDRPGIRGPVNLTAPNPVTNDTFSKTLAAVFGRRVYFVLPAVMVRFLWGQMGVETLLASARVVPSKLLENGFVFQHETLLPALQDLLGRQDKQK